MPGRGCEALQDVTERPPGDPAGSTGVMCILPPDQLATNPESFRERQGPGGVAGEAPDHAEGEPQVRWGRS